MEKSLKCPNCLSLLVEDVDSCPHCKAELYNCSNCGSLVLETDKLCKNCNSKLYGKETDDSIDRIPGNLLSFLFYLIPIVLLFFMMYFLRHCV